MLRKITDAIGNTPLVEVLKKESTSTRLYLKLESWNPGGSIKDRVAFRMIDQSEKIGLITPGMELVEATSGNTGLGIAWIGKLRGYSVTIVTHDKISKEKLALMRHYGANVIIANSEAKLGTKSHFKSIAESYASEKGRFYLDQFSSPYNVEAHYFSTAPEIYNQTKGYIDLIVCGIGSGGTITGISKFFKERNPEIKIIASDPVGSIYHSDKYKTKYEPSTWITEGIGSNFIPAVYESDSVDEIYKVTDEEAIYNCNYIRNTDGIDIGLSSGANISVARNFIKEGKFKNILCICPDAGERYISKTSSF